MTDNNNHLDQIRYLTKAVFISGGANIVLLALLFYVLTKETPPRPYFELKPAKEEEQSPSLASDQGNAELIRTFRMLPVEQLLLKLTNIQQVENGYTQRDLALGALVTFHHFDLARAFLGQAQPTQQRKIPFGKNRKGNVVEMVVYPGLTEQQYQAIVHYANTERWPFTSEGLFSLIRKKKRQNDPSLSDAFFLTPEFLAVETLFNRSEVHVEKSELLKMLCQGTWILLTTFTEQQRITQDLSPARRQRFLLDYIDLGSPVAANLLLKTDAVFAVRKLDDVHVLSMLNMLVEKTPEAKEFALGLLTSPRSDAVWQAAANRLYDLSGEVKPDKNVHHAALLRFVPQSSRVVTASQAPRKEKSPSIKATPATAPTKVAKADPTPKPTKAIKAISKPKTPKGRSYKVQEGDSLWKIAKRFKVDIEVLKKHNHLQSDFLKPGTTLKIP